MRFPGTTAGIVLTTLCAVLCASEAGAWETTFDHGAGWSVAVAVDPSGDVVATGNVGGAFTVAKLAGGTGVEIWRSEIRGTADGTGRAVTIDAAGDVFAAGTIARAEADSADADWAVVKLAGKTGVELWRRVIDGSGSSPYYDHPSDLAVDGSGNVVVVGQLDNMGTGPDMAVAKLDGATGSVLWRNDVNGTDVRWGGWAFDNGNAVAIDSAGNVLVAGQTDNSYPNGDDFTVVKLGGADGSELWRSGADAHHSYDEEALDVAVDATGDVVAAGRFDGYGSFAVRKISGADGTIQWERSISADGYRVEESLAVAFDSSGDVVAAGRMNGDDGSFTIVKLAAMTGATQWLYREPDGQASAVAVDAHGDVFAGGTAIVKLDGATGNVLWRRDGTEQTPTYTSLALDGAGGVVAVGAYDIDPADGFSVLKLIASNGGSFPCGDGVLDPTEECDDGNVVDGDGCDSNCTLTACGNGVVTAGEECDDGNVTDGDGCSSLCAVEPGWHCEQQPSRCTEICGDGIQTAGEGCDDGNLVDGDGCDSNCTLTACGNGVVTAGEECDDGNLIDNDGCNADCRPTRCGDGFVSPDRGEICDDGNTVDGDGCDSNCTPTACGNGIVTAGEECDDGNTVDRDGCTPDCRVQCNPYSGENCRKRFALARVLRPADGGVLVSSALAAVGNVVAMGSRDAFGYDGAGLELFDADVTAPTFGAQLRAVRLRGSLGGPIVSFGSTLLVARPGAVHQLDAAGNRVRTYTIPGDDTTSAIAAAGDRIAVAVASEKVVYVLDASDGRRIGTLRPPGSDPGQWGAALAIAGNTLAVGSPGGGCPATMYLYDVTTATAARSVPNPEVSDTDPCSPGWEDRFGAAITAVGDRFAVANPGSAVSILDTTGARVQTLLGPPKIGTIGESVGVFGTSVGALGDDVLVGAGFTTDSFTHNGAAYLFDATTGELLWPFFNPTLNDFEDEAFGATFAAVGPNVIIGDPWDFLVDPYVRWSGAYLFVDVTRCGNGTIDPGEQCDDGNTTNGDGCDANCTLTGCGNAVGSAGEECDDGNRVSGDGCDADCTRTRCGNGIVTATWPNIETCDDGNTVDGDGCSSCTREVGWSCEGSPSTCALCGDGRARLAGVRLTVRHVPGHDELTFAADTVLPTLDPALDPAASGVHISLRGALGAIANFAIPAGTSPSGAWRAWRTISHGRRWRYRATTESGGTLVVTVNAHPASNRASISLRATGYFPQYLYAAPLEALVVLDVAHVANGQCADGVLGAPGASIQCRDDVHGRRFECR
jgi:cysteine-rich repeat protein